ncbi:hypothetical protein C1645_835746 [Glomus cerebriforme]|uniref:Uncharacterized protein n=1 Tax=Glomus cerebriforme TaxID=658196 RepID=A0A397S9M3_9GLOM|nr:hypothetical protein C1645_835746 [Glomus cerebriforme]
MTCSNTSKKSSQEREDDHRISTSLELPKNKERNQEKTARQNSSQKSDMHNKSVAKNKCQYIEVDANVEQKQVKYLLECIKRIQRGKQKKINPEDYIIPFLDYNQELDDTKKKYSIAGPSSRMSQEPVFITLSDENEEDKKKANKKKAKSKKKHENQN